MSFRYSLTVPAIGSHKIPRFIGWMKENVPDVACSLPPQVPVDSEQLTVRLRSIADRERIRAVFPDTLP